MAETAQQSIIRIAKAEVGYREGRSGGHWSNDQKYSKEVPGLEWSNRQAWCDTFVHWVALKADVLNLWPDVTKGSKGGSAGCDITANAWKKAGRWSEYPAVGAQVFYGTSRDLNHTGIVTRYDKTYIWTVEGNTNDTGSREGDGVYAKKHRRRDPNVVGYGYPAYPGGIKSADPAWASGKKPGDKPDPKPSGKRFALDWSFSPPDIAKLPANVPGVLRYISPGSGKDLTEAEADRLHKAGKWIGLVYESTAGRAGEGKTAGVSDAKTARAKATALGYPKTAAIFYAVDFDAIPAGVHAYFAGINSVEAPDVVGVYGSKRVVEAVNGWGFAKWLWQTAAWSHHEVASGISFYQNVGTTLKGLGGAWDENTILGPKVPVWHAKKKSPHKPPPPPPPPPPVTKTLEFRVHLVPGNKVRSAGSIRGDMGIVKQKTHGHSAVVFNTERESSAARKAVSDGLGEGWTRVIDNEDTIAYGSNWLRDADPTALLLAKGDPSKAGVSPRRYLDTVLLRYTADRDLPSVTIAMCGTHLVSEANCVHTGVRGRKWREKTWPIQVADVLRSVKATVDSGVPVVLAGDFNTGIFFNGKQLFAELTKRFGDKAVHVHNGSLDHIFLVSTDKVRLSEVGKEVVTENASDHDMVTALIRAEVVG